MVSRGVGQEKTAQGLGFDPKVHARRLPRLQCLEDEPASFRPCGGLLGTVVGLVGFTADSAGPEPRVAFHKHPCPVAIMQAGQVNPGCEKARSPFPKHQGDRRVHELERTVGTGRDVGPAMRCPVTRRSRCTVGIQAGSPGVAIQRPHNPHHFRPVGRPALVLHKGGWESEREVGGTDPRSGAAQKNLEAREAIPSLDPLEHEIGTLHVAEGVHQGLRPPRGGGEVDPVDVHGWRYKGVQMPCRLLGMDCMATKELRFSYILKTLEGEIIDIASPDNPLVFVDGEERFIPGLEAVLRTLGPGEKRTIQLAAADAYGERDPSLVQAIRRELLPPVDLEPGAVFRAGEDVHDPIVTVVSIDGDEVTLDGNHPLAGMDLVFEIETF